MKTDILVNMVSAALFMAHSTASKATSKVTATTTTTATASATATANNEARSRLPRHGKTLCTYGDFVSSEDTTLALAGLSSLFESKAGKSLSQFHGGGHVNRVVYAHNTAQAYVCGWGMGKFTLIEVEDIFESVDRIRIECGGVSSSTGEIWFPDLDYSIGYGRFDGVTCAPKTFRHIWGRMLGLV
ncbi:59831ff8-e419-4881-83dd-c2072bc92944 [Sclerotinia trifoliorum]|uniref:59831ff8-e419-4881-83dd-c2072bc92944 n=1 Tax=Sclerotinia trifoliorum TaxID=28548 RepID=A0A8H2VRN7_9HELO|nr:59831ff8-e419-4881-83dd-c2072bc92944 [Sclerotinia trifoliorum]